MIIDITENAKLALTPRRYSCRNIICARIGVFLLALETRADSSDVEIGAEKAQSGLVRDLGSKFVWHAHDITSALHRWSFLPGMVHYFLCISILFEFLI